MRRKTRRSVALRRMLDERRLQLQLEVQRRLRSARTDHSEHGRDELDVSEDATGRDLDQALLQMRAEALARIKQALGKLDSGDYGWCDACGAEIAEPRLRALPFAIRCHACEQAREESGRAGALTGTASSGGDVLRP